MANGHGGARPNSGRKSKAEEMGLAALLDECWELEQRKECIRVLSARSRAGDIEACKLLLAYAYGKPTQPYEDVTRRASEELAASAGVTLEGTG